MVALQRADPLDRDESIALAMDEERYKRDASVIQPESGRQRELLKKHKEIIVLLKILKDIPNEQQQRMAQMERGRIYPWPS